MSQKVKILKLKNTYVIAKDDNDFFQTTNNSIIIPTFNFFAIIKFMLFRGLISDKSLIGILEEYHSAKYNE